jgi:hypothetical protein
VETYFPSQPGFRIIYPTSLKNRIFDFAKASVLNDLLILTRLRSFNTEAFAKAQNRFFNHVGYIYRYTLQYLFSLCVNQRQIYRDTVQQLPLYVAAIP